MFFSVCEKFLSNILNNLADIKMNFSEAFNN